MPNTKSGANEDRPEEQGGNGWRSELQDQISGLAEQVQEHSADLAGMAQSGVRSWPMVSVLGAQAIGMGIGLVAGASCATSSSSKSGGNKRRR